MALITEAYNDYRCTKCGWHLGLGPDHVCVDQPRTEKKGGILVDVFKSVSVKADALANSFARLANELGIIDDPLSADKMKPDKNKNNEATLADVANGMKSLHEINSWLTNERQDLLPTCRLCKKRVSSMQMLTPTKISFTCHGATCEDYIPNASSQTAVYDYLSSLPDKKFFKVPWVTANARLQELCGRPTDHPVLPICRRCGTRVESAEIVSAVNIRFRCHGEIYSLNIGPSRVLDSYESLAAYLDGLKDMRVFLAPMPTMVDTDYIAPTTFASSAQVIFNTNNTNFHPKQKPIPQPKKPPSFAPTVSTEPVKRAITFED